MNLKRALSAWLSGFFLFGMMLIPAPLKAAETFNPTVSIISYKQLLNGQVVGYSSGSGTLITNNGKVLTNAHVIMDEELNKPLDAFAICVSENSQNPPTCRFTGALERYDEKIDLAVLNVKSDTVNGTLPTAFPFLPYNHGITVGEGDSVTVKGFPASGGVTIHTTQGQISGFEQWNGYTYLKTDADIDAGNSGGTMLDADGNFVGIPSYVRSYYQTSGRALNIADAAAWLNANGGTTATMNTGAEQRLKANLTALNDAQKNGSITLKNYPKAFIQAPAGWSFVNANEEEFHLQKNDSPYLNFAFTTEEMAFDDEGSVQEFVDAIKNQWGAEVSQNQIETVSWKGRDAVHIWGTENDIEMHFYILPHGYAYGMVIYFAPTSLMAEAKSEFDSLLNSLDFKASQLAENPNATSNLDLAQLPFTLQTPSPWKAFSQLSSEYNVLQIEKDSGALEDMEMTYYEVAVGDNQLSASESLQLELDQGIYPSFKSDKLVIDGMPAWIYIDEEPFLGETIKKAVVGIMDPEYEFQLSLTAESSQFDSAYQAMINSLKGLKSKRYNANAGWTGFKNGEVQGEYFFPEVTNNNQVSLSDIAGHRYEDSIKRLVQLGVLKGYADGTFKPEDPVNRAEALKFILESLRIMQANNNQEPFVMPADFNAFPDVDKNFWFATYVAEGLDKGIIKGYPDGTFQGENTVILAEALKMALEAHSETPAIQVWSGDTDPWYKKYFDTAYDLYLLPEGLNDPAKPLTRGELAYIIDGLVWYWPAE